MLCFFPYFKKKLGPLLLRLKMIVLINNIEELDMNSHPWAPGKVINQDRWLLIGGSLSGGSRGAPRSCFQKQKKPYLGRNMLCIAPIKALQMSLEHSTSGVYKLL